MFYRICFESKPALVFVNIILITLVCVNLYTYQNNNSVNKSPPPIQIQDKRELLRNNRKFTKILDEIHSKLYKKHPKNLKSTTETSKFTTISSDNDYKLPENSTFDFEAWKNVQASRRSAFIEEE